MKNSSIKIIIFSIICLSVWNACNKNVVENGLDLAALAPSKLDTNAGVWKTVLLVSPSDIALAAPTATNSSDYQAEISNLKTTMGSLTNEQKSAVQYWSGGVVLRWNQIMRELVAKHNLPPVESPDGTYPIPDANNPFNYPTFPFSNPPYSARAYAYASISQYDALVTANFYKKQFNRALPSAVDASVIASVPSKTTASYPSESAVIAAASYQVLKRLFPTDTVYLFEKYNESKNFDLWSGMAVQSDVTAGDNIGKSVAAKVMARAGADNMKFSVGNPTVWDSLANRITSAGGTPWVSQENPKRPPMLPLFGNVKTWLLTPSSLISVRPIAPFAIGSAEFKAQLEEVKSEVTTNSTREKIAIVHFWADGVGTYTPPGHWNYLAAELIYSNKQSEVRSARNLALLNMALMDAGVSCWDTKAVYYLPRPSQMDGNIKTLTGLPNFPSYTSGHSTFSGAAATFLAHIFPNDATRLNGLAEQASLSRLYGGIHYRMDCDAGLKSGNAIGDFAVQRAKIDGAE